MFTDEPQIITLSVKGPKKVLAKDFVVPSQVEILNPDLEIANLTSKDAKLKMEVTVEKGLGYVPKEVLQKEKIEIGTMILDAIFTPVRRVNYEVENMRVGERTDYNRLRFVIETDGSIKPREALEQAIKIIIKQLQAIVGIEEIQKIPEEEITEKFEETIEQPVLKEETKLSETDVLKTRIEDLKLAPRILDALAEAGIRTLGGLIRKKEEDLMELEGIGKKAVEQIKEALAKFGLTLK